MPPGSRHTINLAGTWSLAVLDDAEHSALAADVAVPGPWTVQVPGHGDSHATVRYTREFEWTPSAEDGRQFVLRFGGVNHSAVVELNGREVGRHEGAWTAFECDVTGQLRPGANALSVLVSYPPRWAEGQERSFLEVPHGKQSWYGTTAGIWGAVELEERDHRSIGGVVLVPGVVDESIRVDAKVSPEAVDATLRIVVKQGGEVAGCAEFTEGGTRRAGEVAVPAPRLWSPALPVLYDVDVELVADGVVVDQVSYTTGFRTIETRDGRILLNGHDLEIRAVLDQDYHPRGSSVPDSIEEWEALLQSTKELGFNMLRVHIKRPDPRYFEIADRLGILVWAELPSWLVWSPAVAEEGIALLERMIGEDGHHPSIVIWTIINESWGIDLTSPEQRAWLRSAFDRVKKVAEGALVVDNSACEPNFHLHSDLDDYHVYRGIPESRREWDAKIADFASRPEWTYSPYGDAVRTGAEPLVLSEFGNWGLPYALDLYEDGQEPWWFLLGAEWASGTAEGTELMRRFHTLGLDEVFGSWDSFVTELHRAQSLANRYQTLSIRSHPEIAGYVLTQLSDVLWEANGLFDMNRAPKRFTSDYAMVNGPRAVAIRPERYSAFEGERLQATITSVPARAGHPIEPCDSRIRILVDGEEVFSADDSWTERTTQRIELPALVRTGEVSVTAEIVCGGEVIARDVADLVVVSPTPSGQSPEVVAADAQVGLWLTTIGIDWRERGASDGTSGLLVASQFNDDAREYACAGGRVLILAEDEDALGNAFSFLPAARLTRRAGDGDWVPRVEWLDRSGAFATVPGRTILDIAFEELLGDFVIAGIPSALRSARVSSGTFSGWLRGAASSTVTFRWSEGVVTVTTFKLRTALPKAPVAAELGRAMIRLAAS